MAIKLGDQSGSADFGLGLTLLAQSHYADAVAHLETAVQRNPQEPERRLALVGAELQLKQLDKARSELAQIKKRFPQEPALAYREGKMLLEFNLPDDAESEFERAANALAPADNGAGLNVSDLHLQMARLRFDHRDYRGALDFLEKIIIDDVAPSLRASALHLEGQALVGVGKAPEAVEKLREAAEMNPANPEFFVHLAWADLLAGDRQSALTIVQFAQSKWPNVADVQLMQTLLQREGNPSRTHVALSQPWRVKGDGLVCCPCKTPCPCRSNGRRTHPHCENTGLIRIQRGHYGNISLDGFSFVMVNNEMETRTSPDVLYVSTSATDEQLIALERIVQSFDPLQPSILLNVERAPILFSSGTDNTYEVRIPKRLEIRIRCELNSKGEPLFATAALDQFSNIIEYAKNLTYKFWDANGALKWDYSGRQANFRIIDLDSNAYTSKTMLIQFADSLGRFNKKQLELIALQKLPLPHLRPESTEVDKLPHKK